MNVLISNIEILIVITHINKNYERFQRGFKSIESFRDQKV